MADLDAGEFAIAFDRERSGFWQGTRSGVRLLSVEDGQVVLPPATTRFGFGPFSDGNADFSVKGLSNDPSTGSIIGVVEYAPGPDFRLLFFEGDPDSGEGGIRQASETRPGFPAVFTTLGPPPAEYQQLVPIVGGGPGAHGTDWSTELWVYNPSRLDQTALVRRVTRPSVVVALDLPSRGSVAIPDVLTWIGGGEDGDGTRHEALVITSNSRWGEQLVVSGRITTPAPHGGRYGHAVPAVPSRVGYSNHMQYVIDDGEIYQVQSPGLAASHIDLDMRIRGRFRYNVGVVNDHSESISLQLLFGYSAVLSLGDRRPPETEREVTVAPHSVRVFDLEALFPPSVLRSWAPRIAVLGSQPAAVWLSVVDNLTGDATFVPFTSYHYFEDSEEDRLVLPVAAHGPGLGGSRWRTDLVGFDVFPEFSNSYLVYHPSRPATECGGAATHGTIEAWVEGQMGSDEDEWELTLNSLGIFPYPGRSDSGFQMFIDDVIGHLPACRDESNTKGGLEVAAGSWFAGYSRTYSTTADGGTYGSMLPLYPPGGWPQQHFAGLEVNESQRINLGLYNGMTRPVTHRLRLYAADGTLAVTRRIIVQPHGLIQRSLQSILGVDMLPSGLYGLTVTPLDEPDSPGRSWAYVSIIDNTTNDPINLW